MMRTVALAVAIVAMSCGVGFAQTPPPAGLPNGQPVSNAIPATGGEPGVLPGGTDISRPLTPVGPLPEEPKPVVVENITPPKPEIKPKEGPLGPWWDTDELLLWYPKANPMPPLVTGTRSGALPVFGQAGTQVLVGGRAIDNQVIAGGRFIRGWSLNPEQTVGIEFSYFFLGTRSANITINDQTSGYSTLGMPYINALTGREEVLTIAQPGVSSTFLTASTSTRVQGFEANAVANLFAVEHAKLHFLAGYRYFQVNEGLRIEQTYIESPSVRGVGLLGRAADQFDTANRFSGGQLGLHADLTRGPFFMEMIGKISFGQNYEVLRINGETHTTTIGPQPVQQAFPSGVYAQMSNSGRFTRSVFAVMPEATFKIGLKLGDSCRVFTAYNMMYLSDAVRPGDQVDRVLNPSQVPLLGGPSAMVVSDRPRAVVNRSDFWVQGVVIGLEGRY